MHYSTIVGGKLNGRGDIAWTISATGYYSKVNGETGTFSIPGAVDAGVTGINDTGTIVGLYLDGSSVYHGFINDGGTVTTVDFTGVGITGTWLMGIANNGVICGVCLTATSNSGFTYSNVTFSAPFNYPSTTRATTTGINDSGLVVGNYTDLSGYSHGFLYDGSSFTSIDYPGATNTETSGINNSGQIVVNAFDAMGNVTSYIYDGVTFTEVLFADNSPTNLDCINDAGEMIGNYYNAATSTTVNFIASNNPLIGVR